MTARLLTALAAVLALAAFAVASTGDTVPHDTASTPAEPVPPPSEDTAPPHARALDVLQLAPDEARQARIVEPEVIVDTFRAVEAP